MHFEALRLVALREVDRTEETPATETRGEFYANLCTYIQPTELFAAVAQLAAHSEPALRTGLMAPALRPALYIWGGSS